MKQVCDGILDAYNVCTKCGSSNITTSTRCQQLIDNKMDENKKKERVKVFRKEWYYMFGVPVFYKLVFIKYATKESAKAMRDDDNLHKSFVI